MSEASPGCGLVLAPVDTPTHAYNGELLARDYSDGEPETHRLAVDTYAVQHPGGDDRRARRSVALHLVALHLTLERWLASEAEDVWAAWSEHHERARAWAG